MKSLERQDTEALKHCKQSLMGDLGGISEARIPAGVWTIKGVLMMFQMGTKTLRWIKLRDLSCYVLVKDRPVFSLYSGTSGEIELVHK